MSGVGTGPVHGECRCGAHWTGARVEHCTVCHESFSGTGPGDRHRVGGHHDGTRRCLTRDEMRDVGLVLDGRGIWCFTVRSWMPPATRRGAAQMRERPGLVVADADGLGTAAAAHGDGEVQP